MTREERGHMKLLVASDHAGFTLKEYLKKKAQEWGYDIIDYGTNAEQPPVDYSDIALKMVDGVQKKEGQMGLLICGSGIGISIAANRHSGIRAALCHDMTSARIARSHNDANILVLGERLIGTLVAEDCFKIFLETPFEGGRHIKRVEKLG